MRNFALLVTTAFVLLLCAYSNHFDNSFHFDDSHTIENNLYIRNIGNIPSFFTDSKTSSSLVANQSYRPIVTTSLAIDYWLGGGLNPLAFHRSMFAVYCILLISLFFLFSKCLYLADPTRDNKLVALFATAFFGLHAANAETINYIISRSDLYSTTFVVWALLCYAYIPKSRWGHLGLVPLALGMLTKEAAIVFPGLLFFYLVTIERRNFIDSLKRSIPSIIVCTALILLNFKLAPQWQSGGTSRLLYLFTQPFVIVHYLCNFILPLQLSADTDWTLVSTPYDTRVFVGLFIIGLLLAIAYRQYRNNSSNPITFGILWFFVALLPTSSVLPLAEVLNDHRTFFPYIGLALASTWYCNTQIRHHFNSKLRNYVPVIVVVILLGHAYGTFQRNTVWKNEESLWLDVTIKSPLNGRGLMNYGLTQMEKGNLTVAKEFFERALKLTPNYAHLNINLGIVNGALGNAALAEVYFNKAIELQPGLAEPYSFYGRWLIAQGKYQDGIVLLKRALSISPADQFARGELLKAYVALNDTVRLQELVSDTLRINPQDPLALRYKK